MTTLITIKILDDRTANAVKVLRNDGYCLSDVIRKFLVDEARKVKAQKNG